MRGKLKKGLDLAVEEFNAKAEEKIEVVYQDNQGNAPQAVSIFQRFATVDNVAVVMTCFTPIAKSLRPLAAQNGVPLVATVVSALNFGAENEWSFRDFPPQDQQSNVLAAYARNTLKLKKVGAIIVNDDYGRDGYTAFSTEFSRLGGKVFEYETAEQKDLDFKAQVLKAIANKPDGLYVVIRDNALGTLVKQLREAGFTGQILGVNAFDAPVVWTAAGNAGEGVVFTSALMNFEGNPAALDFKNRFQAKYVGESPDWVAAYGYTIGNYLSPLLVASKGNRDVMRKQLAELDRNSIRGQLKMSAGRDVLSPIGIYKRVGSEKKLILSTEPLK